MIQTKIIKNDDHKFYTHLKIQSLILLSLLKTAESEELLKIGQRRL